MVSRIIISASPRGVRSAAYQVLLLLLLVLSPLVFPDQNQPAKNKVHLEPVTIVTHRHARDLSEVAGTVTVIDQERLERELVLDTADALRYEPGIEAERGDSRFGFNGFRIRGIGGNRTLVLVDNVPVGERYSVGNFADTGRGLLELDLASRMEVLRGPASTVYGSKALGGVVSIAQLEPEDLLNGSNRAERISLGAGSGSDRQRLSLATAGRHEAWSWLVGGALRSNRERNVPEAAEGIDKDLVHRRQSAILLRAARSTGWGQIRLTFDAMQDYQNSEPRMILGRGRFSNTTLMTADDESQQWRFLIDGKFENLSWISRGHWRLWHQQQKTGQETSETRATASPPLHLYRRFKYEQQGTGVGIDLERDGAHFGLSSRSGFGMEIIVSDIEQLRSGLQTNLNDSSTRPNILGEDFPLRDFPRTQISEFGVYFNEEIQLWQAGPIISPGLRYEYTSLKSRSDSLYEQSFPNTRVVSPSYESWTPRLGLVWPVGDQMDLFAQYARGFRSPPFGDVNIGLDIPMFGIRAIPNPDLKPEKGETFEVGLRWFGLNSSLELAVFRNDYRDFIHSRASLGPDPDDPDTRLFQSVNRDSVRIEGIELRLEQNLTVGVVADLAIEAARGYDRKTDRVLPDVAPPKFVLGIAWQPSVRGNPEYRLVTTAARGQRNLEDESGDPLFSAKGYATVDFLANWYPHPDTRFGIGLLNIGDVRYWRNAAVSGLDPDDPALPYYAEAGRAVVASATLHFR